jgi:hypothetical protein
MKHLSVVNYCITRFCDSKGCQPCNNTNFCVRVQGVSPVTTLISLSEYRVSVLHQH